MIDYLDFKAGDVPFSRSYSIGERTLRLTFLYNAVGDFYTCEVYDESGALIYTTKAVYWNDLLHSLVTSGRAGASLVPLDLRDLSGEQDYQDRITPENFGDPVRVCIL